MAPAFFKALPVRFPGIVLTIYVKSERKQQENKENGCTLFVFCKPSLNIERRKHCQVACLLNKQSLQYQAVRMALKKIRCKIITWICSDIKRW